MNQPGLLSRRQVSRVVHSAREQKVRCMQPRMPDPCCDAVAGLLGNLELYRPLRLLLHDRRAVGDALAANGNLAF